MTNTTTIPQVYVTCPVCTEAGDQVGEWVDADEAAACVPCTKPGHNDSWLVEDSQDFEGLMREDCSPAEAERLAELFQRIVRTGSPVAAFVAYADHIGAAPNGDDISQFEDAYNGEWASEEEFAEDLAESIGAINSDSTWPNSYIDWERAARDLFMGDYFSVEKDTGGLFVFRS